MSAIDRPPRLREAQAADAPTIAALHASSWRLHYRGAYRDDYLDGDVFADRERVWSRRLADPPHDQLVLIVEQDGRAFGFACAYGGHDPRWGSFLDNIHVDASQQSRGAGTLLVRAVIDWCLVRHADAGLYLWVLAQNARARRFYERLGATDRGGEISIPAGGGRIHGRRYAWDAGALADGS